MSILSALKGVFGGKVVDLEGRFRFGPKWIQGATGRFHFVEEAATGNRFGLKIVDSAKAKKFRDRFAVKSFPSEGEIALSLHHNNIVKTHEIGISKEGNEFILMDLLEGPLLEAMISERDRKLAKLRFAIMAQLTKAVQAVHNAGFIHRDICPRNVILDSQSRRLKLFDFGITLPDQPAFRQPRNRTGTPLYMAPEIVRRKETDSKVDMFSLGVTMYQILVFEHPWGLTENTSKSALLFDSRKPTDIREHDSSIDAEVAAAIHSCLEPDPAKRCPSVKHLHMAFKASSKFG